MNNVMSCTIAHCGCYTSFNIGESIVICTMIICVTILMYRILLMVRDWVEDIISMSNCKEVCRAVIGLCVVLVFIVLITVLCYCVYNIIS